MKASEEGIAGAPFASVLVNDLAVRLEPGTSAGLVQCAPDAAVRLSAGDMVLVLPDPPAVDETSTWHRVVAPTDDGLPGLGTPCDDVPFVVGWIAAGLGDPWVSADLACPDRPSDLAELEAASAKPLLVLACFGPSEFTVHGTLVPPPEGGIGLSCPGIEPAWLSCGIDQVTDGGAVLSIRIPPDTVLPAGTGFDLTVAVDHHAAEGCVDATGLRGGVTERYAPEAVVAFCRSQLVAVP